MAQLEFHRAGLSSDSLFPVTAYVAHYWAHHTRYTDWRVMVVRMVTVTRARSPRKVERVGGSEHFFQLVSYKRFVEVSANL